MRLFIVISFCSLFASCGSLISKDPAQDRENFGVSVSGSFAAASICRSPVVLRFFKKAGDEHHYDFIVLERPRGFDFRSFNIPARIDALCDANKDFRRQDSELYLTTTLSGDELDALRDYSLVLDFGNTSSSRSQYPARPGDVTYGVNNSTKLNRIAKNIGSLVDLDNENFSANNAKIGLWKPMQFAARGLNGLYFSETYDLKKPVVLFIHGIGGSPAQFKGLANRLNTAGFQFWYYYYASGFPLASNSQELYTLLRILGYEIPNLNLHIVAHSMGGLISRDYITRCTVDNNCAQVRSFTSISTPWGGHASAEIGLKYARSVVPVWRDMAPESTFFKQLFARSLPENLPHYLIFGIKQRDMLVFQTNDGVVSMASMLEEPAQEQAHRLIAINEDHTKILENHTLESHLIKIFSNHSDLNKLILK